MPDLDDMYAANTIQILLSEEHAVQVLCIDLWLLSNLGQLLKI